MYRIATAAALLAAILPAVAQDRATWFKSLRMPSGASCCDLSDCRRTEATWRGQGWTAVVNGAWTPIPGERVLDRPKSIDGDAYVCSSPSGVIYCFVPPWTVY